jgi:pyruvate dehydrogenase E1 component alpha subunit
MPRKTIETFKVEFLQIMDENIKVDKKLLPKINNKELLNMYKTMVLSRIFDEKLFTLQRSGRIGTVAQSKGQEAAQIGAVACLNKNDWVIPSFRELSAALYRGLPLKNVLLYSGGYELGSIVEGKQTDLPTAIPVGSQLVHAVGIAWGMKLKKKKTVSLVFFGDGATSEGEVHEALNFAGVYQVPCVFICQNNQYAISTPVSKQTRANTLAQKAIAYGMEGIMVDGNDIFAVYSAVKEAVKKARLGKGPTFIECLTYRLSDHTTSDDASRYRKQSEVNKEDKKDPIVRLKKYLLKQKIWSEKQNQELQDEVKGQIEIAVEEYEKTPPPSVEDIFSFTFQDLNPHLQEQLDDVKNG